MNPTPYLTFHGTCREAMTAYARILGGEIDMMMLASEMPEGEMPGGVPEDKADWILHCGIQFDGGTLMASDDIFGGSEPMAGCAVMVSFDTVDRGREVFDALAEHYDQRAIGRITWMNTVGNYFNLQAIPLGFQTGGGCSFPAGASPLPAQGGASD